MAENILKFRKGLYEKLKDIQATKDTAGTIYVTTDESAMYVDIYDETNGAQRLRIGETFTFESVDDFANWKEKTTPPYDENAFYYIVKENALLRYGNAYTSSGLLIGKQWLQINDPSEVVTIGKKVEFHKEILETITKFLIDGNAHDLDGYDLPDEISTFTELYETAFSTLTKSSIVNAETDKEQNPYAGKTNIIAILEALKEAAVFSSSWSEKLDEELKKLSNSINDQTVDINSLKSQTAELQESIDSANNDISDLEEKQQDLQSALDNLRESLGGVNSGLAERVTDIESKIKEFASKTDLANLESLVDDIQAQIDNGETGLTALNEKLTTLEKKVAANESAINKNQSNIATNTANIATNTKDIATNTTNIANQQNEIDSVKKSIGDSKLDKDAELNANEYADYDNKNIYERLYAIRQRIEKVDDSIAESINAANGMTYKGIITSQSDLPSNDVQSGDTYIVSTPQEVDYIEITINGIRETATSGDLVIASGTEGADGYIPSGSIIWQVVKTGYIEAHESTLQVSGGSNTADVKLKSYVDTLLGKFSLTSNSLVIEVDANGIISLNQVWEDF